MRIKVLIIGVVLAGLAGLLIHHSRRGNELTGEVRQQLRTMLREPRLPASIAAGDDSASILIRRFYKQRRYQPAWVGPEPLPRAKELVEVLRSAGDEGLDPDDYGTRLIGKRWEEADQGPLSPPPQPVVLADLDLRLTAAFLRYGSDLFDGRVDPGRLPAEWRTRPRRVSMLAKLQEAVERDRVRETLQALAPPHRGYDLLRQALARYREIADAGGWSPVPPGPTLARGKSSGPRVVALRERLAASGDLASGAASGARFDATLENAVKSFQARQGLEITGRVGAAERAALNQPVEARINQIEINMERWRWLPEDLGNPAILVNIPDFMLRVDEGGRPRMEMRVIVGKEVDRTPVFSDEISYVVFGPSWGIPKSIVTEEIVPALQSDPGYLARHHIRVFEGNGPDAREVDPGRLDGWFAADPAEFSFKQDPGPENPLGRVKFMCPNQFDVYLHDTPADHLFEQRLRSFSHGCIRVEKPAELATYLLDGKDGWGSDRVAAAMDSAREESVTLPKPVPVHILYWTAWVDDRGALQFRPDLYGLDAITSGALWRHDRQVEETLSKALNP